MATHSTTKNQQKPSLSGPFDGKSNKYQAWKHQRLLLQDKSQSANAEPILISSSLKCAADHDALRAICTNVKDHGYGWYQWTECPADISNAVAHLNARLSLTGNDRGVVQNDSGLSLLEDKSGTDQGRYVPYTARAMGWHTDGYYNDPAETLRSFTLHCINPAAAGGALSLLDYELILIALYDTEPDLVELLCDPQSMMLPANKDDLGHNRPDRHAPVFYQHADGTLGVRFTTRTKNINWRTGDTRCAAERMATLIADSVQWQRTIRLDSGQGIITRNTLHCREAFANAPPLPSRQMLRGRYTQLPALGGIG